LKSSTSSKGAGKSAKTLHGTTHGTTHGAAKSPALPRMLGYAGALPFAAGALASFVPDWKETAVLSQKAYGSAILSFVGAVHWGLALRSSQPRTLSVVFAYSVMPALIAWVASMVPDLVALFMLTLGLGSACAIDLRMLRPVAPAWYLRMRFPLTAIASISLMGTATVVAQDVKAEMRDKSNLPESV